MPILDITLRIPAQAALMKLRWAASTPVAASNPCSPSDAIWVMVSKAR